MEVVAAGGSSDSAVAGQVPCDRRELGSGNPLMIEVRRDRMPDRVGIDIRAEAENSPHGSPPDFPIGGAEVRLTFPI